MQSSFLIAGASFAQERIFLHEQIRFRTKTNYLIYLISHVYRITSDDNSLSISRLRRAFQAVLTKHSVLRTALYFNYDGTIMQRCVAMNQTNTNIESDGISVIDFHPDDIPQLNVLIQPPDLFDLSKGRVIQCHILRQRQFVNTVSVENNDILAEGDILSFSIHHSAFDGVSKGIFFRDLAHAYRTGEPIPVDDNELQYIDYSVNERLIDTTLSQEFWQSEFEGYNHQTALSLPFDRHRPPTDQRSNLGHTAEVVLDNEISTAFVQYASVHHVTLFQLGLATFYAFLFKLTHGQNDLCISSLNSNRYRSELQNVIGMFVATLPYRMKLNAHESFDDLVEDVRTKALSILDHSHYSLQNILADLQLNQSNASFLETAFEFTIISNNEDRFSLGDTDLERIFVRRSSSLAKFDFLLSFVYNSTFNRDQLSFGLVCSADVLNKTTVTGIAQRFNYFLSQIFEMRSTESNVMDGTLQMHKLSVILPEEAAEIQSATFRRISNLTNEGMCSNRETNNL